MGEVVNLRQARKRAARAVREKLADDNRVTHGLTKADRSKAATERDRASRDLEGKRRDGDPAEPDA